MAIEIEKEGKTVSEAIISACEELGVSRNDVEIEVLREPSKGVLGIGERLARVKVSLASEMVSDKGLKSKKTLENILEYLVSAYSVVLREKPDMIKLEVNMGGEKGLIIGKRGETLKSLEYLVGRIGSKDCSSGRDKRVYIDIDGYMNKKEENINKIVSDIINKVIRTKKKAYINRMSAGERRLAYIALKKERGVDFETIVEGDRKKILVKPSGSK